MTIPSGSRCRRRTVTIQNLLIDGGISTGAVRALTKKSG